MVGGNPVRSKVTRRNSISLSARGLGDSPFASNLARTKASIGFVTQALLFTTGKVGSHGVRKAQGRCPRAARWLSALADRPGAVSNQSHDPVNRMVARQREDIGPTFDCTCVARTKRARPCGRTTAGKRGSLCQRFYFNR